MIAIQGHSTRGKEVIQILESLGGRNIGDCLGTRSNKYYYLDPCLNISTTSVRYNFKESEIFTLEEFEKEFPFKIGDKVRDCSDDEIGVITDLTYIDNMLIYNVDFVNSGQAFMPTEQLKPYKEMKEKRNITLTLDKAKEWYKKGGELREIALQAFNEKELNPLPRSWDEYCRRYEFCCFSTRYANIPLKYDALIKLEQLRNCWCNGWEPDWNDDQQTKYCIVHSKEFKIHILYETRRFLSFPTIEMAKEFLECFRDLIEKAKDLI